MNNPLRLAALATLLVAFGAMLTACSLFLRADFPCTGQGECPGDLLCVADRCVAAEEGEGEGEGAAEGEGEGAGEGEGEGAAEGEGEGAAEGEGEGEGAGEGEGEGAGEGEGEGEATGTLALTILGDGHVISERPMSGGGVLDVRGPTPDGAPATGTFTSGALGLNVFGQFGAVVDQVTGCSPVSPPALSPCSTTIPVGGAQSVSLRTGPAPVALWADNGPTQVFGLSTWGDDTLLAGHMSGSANLDPFTPNAPGGRPYFARRGPGGALRHFVLGGGSGELRAAAGAPAGSGPDVSYIVGNVGPGGSASWPGCASFSPVDGDQDGYVARLVGDTCEWLIGVGGLSGGTVDVSMTAVATAGTDVYIGGIATAGSSGTIYFNRDTTGQNGTADGRDGFVARIDASGAVIGLQMITGGGAQTLDAITPATSAGGSERIVVAGTAIGTVTIGGSEHALPPGATSSWIASFDLALTAVPAPTVYLLPADASASGRVVVRALARTSDRTVLAAGGFTRTFSGMSANGADAFLLQVEADLSGADVAPLTLTGNGDEEIYGVVQVAGGYAIAAKSSSDPLNLSYSGASAPVAVITGIPSGGGALLVVDALPPSTLRSKTLLQGNVTLANGLGYGSADQQVRAAASFSGGTLSVVTEVPGLGTVVLPSPAGSSGPDVVLLRLPP